MACICLHEENTMIVNTNKTRNSVSHSTKVIMKCTLQVWFVQVHCRHESLAAWKPPFYYFYIHVCLSEWVHAPWVMPSHHVSDVII